METTFEAVARIWHGTKAKVWSKHHWRNVLNTFENEAFPIVGHLPITKVRQAHVLQVLDPMQDRGAIDQAHRLRQRMSDVFLYAISKGMAEDDPAAMVRKALAPVVKRNYPALTVIEDARKLLRKDAEKLGWPTTKLASRLLALTAARSEALRFSNRTSSRGWTGPSQSGVSQPRK
jgi:site-specific recombinase XerD